MLNPFESNEANETNMVEDLIEIWVEVNGKKKNTYVYGWKLDLSLLKEHLRTIKKKKGCNGTIKKMERHESGGLVQVLQFQGDHSDYVNEYLQANGVNESIIKIKG